MMEAENLNLKESKPKTIHKGILQPDIIPLTNILPAEIWNLVSEKLLNFDRDNLAKSSPFFHKLLAPQITTQYIHDVLAILAKTVWKTKGLEGLPISDIFNCRAVCSKWNKGIYKLMVRKFQDLMTKDETGQKIHIGSAFHSLIRGVEFSNSNTNNKPRSPGSFLRHFELAQNPSKQYKRNNQLIFSRLSVVVQCKREPNEDEYQRYQVYLRDIASVLSRYGKFIQTFRLQVCGYDFGNNPALLPDWLREMPNLTVLSIFSDDWYIQDNEYINYIFDETEGHRFKKLVNLHKLHFYQVPGLVCNKLIEVNNHISTLDLDFYRGNYDFCKYSLPNLETFYMEIQTAEFVRNLDSSQFQWPLESLTLKRVDDPFVSYAGFAEMFQVIQNKFANTLVSLDFGIDTFGEDVNNLIWWDCKNCRLNLPKLRTIYLSLGKNDICLDFLLPMVNNLEKIYLYVDYKFPRSPTPNFESIVDFMGFEDRLFDSNIWTIFEMLKNVDVLRCRGELKIYSYCRDDWIKKTSNVLVSHNSNPENVDHN